MKQQERYIEYDERIDRYLRNQMTDDERTAFEQDVEQDQELRERLVATSLLVQGIAEEGMRREGQAQLDAIKEMDESEFKNACQGNKPQSNRSKIIKWIPRIAAIALLAIGLYPILVPSNNDQPPQMAEATAEETVKPVVKKQPSKPTLASIANEYNKPIAGEPDEFVAIRMQVQNGDSKEEMMAVIYDIDKIEAPEYVEGAMGAENAEVIKEMQQMHIDCNRWYKALAYLKANDKSSAISELNELVKHSNNEDLINRASALLKKLK